MDASAGVPSLVCRCRTCDLNPRSMCCLRSYVLCMLPAALWCDHHPLLLAVCGCWPLTAHALPLLGHHDVHIPSYGARAGLLVGVAAGGDRLRIQRCNPACAPSRPCGHLDRPTCGIPLRPPERPGAEAPLPLAHAAACMHPSSVPSTAMHHHMPTVSKSIEPPHCRHSSSPATCTACAGMHAHGCQNHVYTTHVHAAAASDFTVKFSFRCLQAVRCVPVDPEQLPVRSR